MTSTKKRIAAALTATILSATLAIPTMATETPTIRVSSYKGSTLEMGERSGLIIGSSGTDCIVTSNDLDMVAVEQVLTVGTAASVTLEVPTSGDSAGLMDNLEIRQE